MRRAPLLLAALFLTMLLPQAAAQPWTLTWEANLGPGYITTTPLVDEEHVYVRTSGSVSYTHLTLPTTHCV